jgi:hypothetical protein
MGILQQIINMTAQARMTANAPASDDTTGVTDQIWTFLFVKPLDKITKDNIIVAIERAYSDVDQLP